MHSFGYRANALLTFAVTILALMCAMASVSDNFNTPTPSAQVQVPLFSLSFHLYGSAIWSIFHPLFFIFYFYSLCFVFPDVGVEHQLVSETAQWQWRGNSCLFLFLFKHNILFRSWVLQDFFLFAFSLQSPSDLGSCVNLRIFVAFHYIMDCHQI